MKTIIILLSGILITGIIGYGLPIVLYNQAINNHLHSSWINIEKHPKEIINGELLDDLPTPQAIQTNRELWRTFHFSNYKLQLPIKHPHLQVIPIVDYISKTKKPNLGFKLIDRNNKTLFSLKEMNPFKFTNKVKLENGKLFTLPIIYNMISMSSIDSNWENLFTKKLLPPPVSLKKIPYNLFILLKRIEYLNITTHSKISYISKSGHGLISRKNLDKNSLTTTEYIYIRRGQLVYPLELTTRNFSKFAKDLRARYLSTITCYESTPDLAHRIYKWYKTLSYKRKIDQEGMLYLFSAWTHLLKEKKLLKEMIQFLERGKNNMFFLAPLYAYAYKKYETDFSRFRKSKNDENEESKGIKVNFSINDEHFTNFEEQIDHYIRKSKEKNIKEKAEFESKKDSLIIH